MKPHIRVTIQMHEAGWIWSLCIGRRRVAMGYAETEAAAADKAAWLAAAIDLERLRPQIEEACA
jgi:hypothetical protein